MKPIIMAKGFNENHARKQILFSFGKDLARRCKSTCELTGESGVALSVYEIPPIKGAPHFDRCIMISENAREQIENPKKKMHPESWRHLNELVWSEIPAVQIMTVRILQHLSKQHQWAQEVLSEAYVDEDIVALAEAASLQD